MKLIFVGNNHHHHSVSNTYVIYLSTNTASFAPEPHWGTSNPPAPLAAFSGDESLCFSLRLCFSNDVCSAPNSWPGTRGWMTMTKIWSICLYCLKYTKCGQMILRTIIEIVATRRQILRLIAPNSISAGAPPQTPLGELTALQLLHWLLVTKRICMQNVSWFPINNCSCDVSWTPIYKGYIVYTYLFTVTRYKYPMMHLYSG